jgi:hypothetical protein
MGRHRGSPPPELRGAAAADATGRLDPTRRWSAALADKVRDAGHGAANQRLSNAPLKPANIHDACGGLAV